MLTRAERQASVVILFLIAGVLMVLVYLVINNSNRASADLRVRSDQVERGQQLFAANCAVCHGDRGQGGVGLKLDTPQNHPTSDLEATQRGEYLTRTITNGRPGTFMPAWATTNGGPFNDQQIDALVNLIMYGNWDQTQQVVDEYQKVNGTPPPPSLTVNTGGTGGNPALATICPCPSGVQLTPQAGGGQQAGGGNAGSTAPAEFMGNGLTINAIEQEYSIKLDTSLVKPGTITFHIQNDGTLPHNISIKELNKTSADVDAGKKLDFQVDLPAGKYTVICAIPGHEQLGMHMMLTVSDTQPAAQVAPAVAQSAPTGSSMNVAGTALMSTVLFGPLAVLVMRGRRRDRKEEK
jgi:mono/diheme cytochrome c family protein/plastocyanin